MKNLFRSIFNDRNYINAINSDAEIQILQRVKIIAQMQNYLNEILPPVFKNYVRIFNFSKQAITMHVINGIASAKIRNLSGRISKSMRQKFQNYCNCQLEIYVQPQTITNYLKISNYDNQNNNDDISRKSPNLSQKNNLFSTQTLKELRNLSQKMPLHPKLQAALDKVIQHKSQQNIQFS